MFHPTVDKVPVGHAYGRADPWFKRGTDLAGLCQKGSYYSVLAQEGGTQFQRISESLAELVEDIVAKAAVLVSISYGPEQHLLAGNFTW